MNAKRARRPSSKVQTEKDARLVERQAKKEQEHYIDERLGFLAEFTRTTKATKITDFSLEKVSGWLDSLRDNAPTARYGCPGSRREPSTRGGRPRAFSKWAVATRRLAWDPLVLADEIQRGPRPPASPPRSH